jgi:DNA-binding transcriptional regulator YiaG
MAPRTIRSIRRKLGLTQAELGAILNYETNTVAKWESGNSKPSSRAVAAIATLRDKR